MTETDEWVLVPKAELRRIFRAGWDSSCEGYNSEYPEQAHKDERWKSRRESVIALRPPIPRKVWDAMVDAGARAMWETESWRARGGPRLIRFSEESVKVQAEWRHFADTALRAALGNPEVES